MNKNLIYTATILFLAACSGNKTTSSEVPQGNPAEPVVSELSKSDFPAKANIEAIPQVINTLGPMESIKDLDKQVESYHLGQNLTADQVQQNVALKQKIIRGTFDIEELCRLSLDKHWATLKTDQQSHFVELMTRLLEQKAIFSKEQLRGENKYYQINYLKEVLDADDKNKSTVTTRMVIAKRKMDLDLTYRLVNKDSGWKIYDVIVDDASLLSNYKFQFDRIIQKGGFEDLTSRMQAKLQQSGGSE